MASDHSPISRIEFPCSRCAHPAATFTLRPAGTGDDLWRDRDRLERAGFLGTTLHFGEPSALAALMAAIERRDYAAVRDLAGPDLIAFHYWQCAADYCEAYRRIGSPKFAADLLGFYDCTRGVCPAGHEQMVDD